MYSAFFSSPPSSPKAQAYRRSTLPSSHKDFHPSSYTTSHHRRHRSSTARMSISALLAFANLPDSTHQRRRLGRLAVFLASLLVIGWVLVSRGAESSWLASLNRAQDADAARSSAGYPASRAIYGRSEGQDWSTKAGQVPLQAAVLPARPAGAASFLPAASAPLSSSEELAALVHFVVSNHHGILPPAALDPSYVAATMPLRADWVLDFEPGLKGAARDAKMRDFQAEVWAENKFIVLGRRKSDGLFFDETVDLLRKAYLLARSEMVFIDIDGRDDAEVLHPLLQRLLATPALPSVVLRGTPLGTFEDVKSLHESGQLKPMLDAAEVQFDKPKRVPKVVKQAKRRNE